MTIHKENGLSLRIADDNPNHHLYRNNGGFWWLHYTAHPTRITVERKRCSLETRSLAIARERRDAIFAHLAFEGGERRLDELSEDSAPLLWPFTCP